MTKLTVKLAGHHVSVVIGKKGKTLNDIKERGQAWIDIPNERGEIIDVSIEGVEKCVVKTVEMMEEVIGQSLEIEVYLGLRFS